MKKLVLIGLAVLSLQAKADYKDLANNENTRIYNLLQQIKCETALTYDDDIFQDLYSKAMEIQYILYPDLDHSIINCGNDIYKEII